MSEATRDFTAEELERRRLMRTCPWCGRMVERAGEMGAVEVGHRMLHAECNRELGTDLAIDELRREIAALKNEMDGVRGSIRYEALL